MTESTDVRIPTPEPISLRQNPLENIRYFKRQWKYFCISTGLNRLSEEKKVATLFLYIGREALTYIHEKLEMNSEEMDNCDRVLAALEASYQPQTNVIYQRFLFNQAVQNASDTVEHFVKKLRELAEQCEFEDRLEEMIRDRFIVGLKDKDIQTELLSKSDLNLSNAVRFCKLKELEEKRQVNPRVDNGQEISIRAHSTTLDVDMRPVECSVKNENLDEDDDLIILNHYQRDCITSSNRATKKIKIESPIGVDDSEEFLPQVVEKESFHSAESTSSLMTPGSFVVLKEDWNKLTDPPIWKIDSPALLQKFIPIEYNGTTLYKSTGVYSGWSLSVRNKYYTAPVEPSLEKSTGKDTIVQFQKIVFLSRISFKKQIEITRENTTLLHVLFDAMFVIPFNGGQISEFAGQ